MQHLQEFVVALHLLVDACQVVGARVADLIHPEYEPGRGHELVGRGEHRGGIGRLGEVVRHEQHEPDDPVAALGEAVLEEVPRRRRHLRAGLPHRVRGDEVAAVAADGRAERPGVGHGHRDGVRPADPGDLVFLRERQHGTCEGVPGEIGLVAGQQEEPLPDRVVSERELQARRGEGGEVVLVELDDGSACAVVEEHVVVEDGERLWVGRVEQVVDETGDGGACIREAGEQDDQRKPLGDGGRVRDALIDFCGDRHPPMLRGARGDRLPRPSLSANTRTTSAPEEAAYLGWEPCRFPFSPAPITRSPKPRPMRPSSPCPIWRLSPTPWAPSRVLPSR